MKDVFTALCGRKPQPAERDGKIFSEKLMKNHIEIKHDGAFALNKNINEMQQDLQQRIKEYYERKLYQNDARYVPFLLAIDCRRYT